MKQIFLVAVLLPFACFSQRVIDVKKDNANPVRDGLFYVVGGVPFSPAKYVEVVSGTPFYSEDFIKADLLVPGGEHKNVPVKLDLLSGDVIYKDSLGAELITTTPIRQVTLHDPATGKDAVFINASVINLHGKEPASGWYQLLTSGNASLYKKIQKLIKETKAYNSATAEQTIYSTNKYFVAVNNTFTEVKKPKELAAVFPDHTKEMDAYLSSNKINPKEDAGWTAAVAYYNSLLSR